MITTEVDDQKRILVPQAKPGQVYVVEENADGGFTLKVVKQAKSAQLECHLAKENGFTVVVPRQPIDELAIKEFLADVP